MKAAKLSFLFVICCLNLALFAQKQDNNETKTISFNKDALGCYKVGMWYYPVTKPDTLIQWSMIALWKPETIIDQLEDAKKIFGSVAENLICNASRSIAGSSASGIGLRIQEAKHELSKGMGLS
jgi:hypothetical protein